MNPRVIYKYPLSEWPGTYPLSMPAAANIVHIGQQAGQVTVWAEVAPDEARVLRHLLVAATGQEYDGDYLGTVQVPNGLVWHVVDLGEMGAVLLLSRRVGRWVRHVFRVRHERVTYETWDPDDMTIW